MDYTKKLKQAWEKLDQSWRVALVAFSIARLFYAIWSGVVLIVEPAAVHYVDVAGKPAVIFLDLYTAKIYPYFRAINGQVLNFRPAGKNTVTNSQTGSIWDIRSGTAIRGQETGSKLLRASYAREDIFPYHDIEPYPNAWLAMWQRFDANWYTALAQNGYGSIPGDDHYPPLYPLLIRFTLPIFRNAFIAGLVISHLAALYAIKLLYNLYQQWDDKSAGRRTLFYFLIYPTSFYLFGAYTESLFLVTALLALRCMKKGTWAWAGFWIFCAVSTRLQGVALFVPMIYLMWKNGSFLRMAQQWAGLAFGGIGFWFYLFLRSTQVSSGAIPFSEPVWHAQLVPPWATYVYAVQTLFSGRSNYIDFINWFVGTLFVILLVLGWRKIPVEYNLYSVSSLLLMLSRSVENQPLTSMSRYSLTLFPLFYIIGLVEKHSWGKRIVIYTFLALSLFLSQLFFVWGWVA